MLCGPKGSAEPSILQCSVCGHRTELFDLPGKNEKYCLACSADVATSILLTTEIDAATKSGEGGGIYTVGEAAVGKSAVGIGRGIRISGCVPETNSSNLHARNQVIPSACELGPQIGPVPG
jgi:hypothetical protein